MLCGQQVPFSGIWPVSGSMRSGRLYPPRGGGRRTGASVFSSSPGLLPTPAAGSFNDGESVESWQARNGRLRALGINGNGMGTPLAIAVQLLPTPNATDSQGGIREVPETRTHRGQDHGPRLRDLAPALLPTPSVADATGGHVTRSGSRKGEPLLGGIAMLLPTPTARLGDDTSRGADPARYKGPQSLNGRRSNLDDCIAAVEAKSPWLGALTGPPSPGGRPSPDGARPGQLSLGEQESG